MPIVALVFALLGAGVAWSQTVTHKPGQGAEGPQARRLPPPAAVAPPLLEAQAPGDRRLAGQELKEAGVLDALAIRALRAVEEQLDDPAAACPRMLAGHFGAQLAQREVALRIQTSGALLQDADQGREIVEEHTALTGRLLGLDGTLARVGRRLGARCSVDGPVTPRLWLPKEARQPTAEGVGIFVDAGAPDRVVWVDGVPRAASGPAGWAVVATKAGTIRVCVAPPEESQCPGPAEVYAVMGSAFALRP